ncbi:hypothetical protein R3P38DRAFT_3202589 [Favolaschia claudopus]|uniref:Uncharacterized protein n=1 Tax=Favolaschia claudopus TaxID=2862362 RepID=A0AAW0AV00_9AGAR
MSCFALLLDGLQGITRRVQRGLGLGATTLELRSAVHYWTRTVVFRPQQLSPVHTLFTMNRYFTHPTKTTPATPPVSNTDLAASGTSPPHNTFPPRSRPEQCICDTLRELQKISANACDLFCKVPARPRYQRRYICFSSYTLLQRMYKRYTAH